MELEKGKTKEERTSIAEYLPIVPLLISALFLWPFWASRAQFNRTAVLTAHVLSLDASRPAVRAASKALAVAGGCRAHWFQGLLAQAVGEEETRDEALVETVRCSPDYVPLIFVILPNHQSLAEQAVRLQPESADAWFWLASARSHEDPQAAIECYRRGLALRPTDGLRWRELGDLLASRDPQAAIEAYLQSCYNGDPGSNGCLRAGWTAERLGDVQAAIRYYRLSRYSGALDRAAQLEQQLREQTPP